MGEAFQVRVQHTEEKLKSLRTLHNDLLKKKQDEYKLKLEAENKKLQDNVERLKKELILVETANGKLQVPLPTKENNPAPKPTPVKINQVQQKPKVEGDNKRFRKNKK